MNQLDLVLKVRAYLRATTEAPEPLYWRGQWVRLTRHYLSLMAEGVAPFETDDAQLAAVAATVTICCEGYKPSAE